MTSKIWIRTPKTILTNEDVIALDQDKLGKQGFCTRDNGDYQIWIKELDNKEKAACLLNRSDEKKDVQVDFSMLLKASQSYWRQDPYELKDYEVRDLWAHSDLKLKGSTMYIELPPHSVKVFRFVRKGA